MLLYGTVCFFLALGLWFHWFGKDWLYPAVVIGGFVAFVLWEFKQNFSRASSLLSAVNQKYGTNFKRKETIGFAGRSDITYFDEKSRKVLFTKLGSTLWWLFDFDAIDRWTLSWTEQTRREVDGVHRTKNERCKFKFYLRDAQQSSISMSVSNYEQGEYWNRQLQSVLRRSESGRR